MDFYKELGLDKICVLLQDLKERCKTLYLICREDSEHIEAINLDEMNAAIQYISGIYMECTGKLYFMDSRLGGFPFSYISEKNQDLLHNQIASYLDGTRYIPDLVCNFDSAFEAYTVSKTSGNPVDISEIIQWKRRFSEDGAALISCFEEMIGCLTDLKPKEENNGYPFIFQNSIDLEKDRQSPIVAVYASPAPDTGMYKRRKKQKSFLSKLFKRKK